MPASVRLVFCALFLLAGRASGADAPASPSAPVTRGQRIFAAHHSYFLAVPPILDELARAGGFADEKFVGTHYIGGSKSLVHWQIKEEDNQAKQALKAGAVDVLILTPVYLPDEGIEEFARFGLAANPDLRVTVMELWLPFDQYEPHFYDPPKIPHPTQVDHNAPTGAALRAMHARYFQEMDAHVRDVNGRLGRQALFVVPVGQAVIALREKIIAGAAPGVPTQENLFTDALGHPGPVMQALIATVHYAVIYRRDPVGLPAPQVLTKLGLPAETTTALNGLLQQLAWDAVVHHPLSGVR